MVTHSSTSRPVQCLCMAERTGCPVLTDLWSYVLKFEVVRNMYVHVVDPRMPSKIDENRKNQGCSIRRVLSQISYP
jgi:hypothetical protein